MLPDNGARGIFPNFDCKNLDYTEISQNPDEDEHYHVTNEDGSAGPIVGHTGNEGPEVSETFAPCFFNPDQPAIFGGGRTPNLFSDP